MKGLYNRFPLYKYLRKGICKEYQRVHFLTVAFYSAKQKKDKKFLEGTE